MPGAAPPQAAQLAELVAYTGLASDGRDLAGRGARVTSLTEIGLPEQTNRQGTTRLEEHDLDRRRDDARASFV